MRLRALGIVLMASGAVIQAATLEYSLTEQTGAESVNLLVTFSDTAVPGSIVGTVAVTPDAGNPNIGDIRGVFFDLMNLVGLTAAQVAADISGADVTAIALNTSGEGGANINPLGPFTIGIEIGTDGIGADDIQNTTFVIANPLLALTNFGAVGVRVQSIGVGTAREGSGKFLDTSGTLIPGDVPGDVLIPEPSTYGLMASAIIALLVRRSLLP